MTQDLDALKPYLRNYVESVTRKSKSGLFVCPICGSGEGAHKTGAFSIDKDERRWKCFSCDRGGDIYDLCAAVEHSDLSDATKSIIARYGSYSPLAASPTRARSGGDAARVSATPSPAPTSTVEPPRDYSTQIEAYAAELEGSAGQSYLQARGLTLDTMKRFNLGYDKDRRAVTIPYNPQGTYFGRRSVDAIAQRKHDNLKGVKMPMFNMAALYTSRACFVVESPLCAISITQSGGVAVAISGTGGKNRLCDQLKERPTGAALILCLDNDEAGRAATREIRAALDEMGAFCVDAVAAIMGECEDPEAEEYRKDPNDVLQKSGVEALKRAVAETLEETLSAHHEAAKAADAERQQRTGAGMVDTFLEDIQTRKYEPMPTGIRDIDRAIGGGFIRQQLILLGAAPGAGKTALAQWIFEGMAQRGTTCIYLNLEMSREQVLARSLSRIVMASSGVKIRTTDILQGYKWTDEQRAAILHAASKYREEIAPRMVYNPDGITANLDIILDYIEREAQQAEKAQAPAPVCVLDYLQLVSGQPREDATNVIKRAVAGLKAYAVRHNTLVFAIVAHKRESNKTGEISMESGRDTSALEYSADLQLALTYTACLKRDGQKGKAPDDLTPDEKRNVTLKVTKGRFGGAGMEVDLFFNGETMTYTQLIKDFDGPARPTASNGANGANKTMRF